MDERAKTKKLLIVMKFAGIRRNLEKNKLTGSVPVGLIAKSNDGGLHIRCAFIETITINLHIIFLL